MEKQLTTPHCGLVLGQTMDQCKIHFNTNFFFVLDGQGGTAKVCERCSEARRLAEDDDGM